MYVSNAQLLLGQGGVVIVSALLVAFSLARAGRSALWQSMGLAAPVCVAAIGAWQVGGVYAAVTVLMAASVFVMLFCSAACILVAKQEEGSPPAAAVASLIFPLGVVLLLSGFAVRFTIAGLVGLIIIGVLSLDLAREESAGSPAYQVPRKRLPSVFISIFISALMAVFFGTILCVSVVSALKLAKDLAPRFAIDAFSVALICPAVLLPLLMKSTRAAATLGLASATRLNASVACLLLAIALPLFVVADYVIVKMHVEGAGLAGLPPISWRLDAPLLIMSGFAMLGLRVGMLRADRWVAMLLLLIYLSYVLSGTLLRFM